MRPCVISGIDPLAREIAGRLAADWRGGVRLVDAGAASPRQAVRRLLAQWREELGAQGEMLTSPRLVVLACAGSPEAANLPGMLVELAAGVKDVIAAEIAPILAVLLPPDSATDDEKIRTSTVIESLDRIVWDEMPIDAVLVNPLPSTLSSNSSAEGPLVDVLLASLRLELEEPELLQPLGTWFGTISGPRLCVDAAKCCYASAASLRLEYPRPRTLNRLRCHFAKELFEAGLLRDGPPTRGEADAAFEAANSLVRSEIEAWARAAPSSIQLRGSAFSRPVLEEHAGADVAEWDQGFDSALSAALKRLPPIPTSADKGPVRARLEPILARDAAGLRSAALFLDALLGRLTQAEEEGAPAELSGLPLFTESILRRPILQAAAQVFEETLPEVLRICQSPPMPARREEEPILAWLGRVVEKAGASFGECEFPTGLLYAGLFQLAATAPRTAGMSVDDARALARGAVRSFLAASSRFAELEAEVREERAAAEQRRASLQADYNWLNRNFRRRADYQRERRAAEQALHNLEARQKRNDEAWRVTRSLFGAVAARVLAPLVVRTAIAAGQWRHASAVDDEFQEYISTIRSELEAQHLAAESGGEPAHPLRQDAATPARVEKLYGKVTGEIPFSKHAELLLQLKPGPESSYRRCANLRDHYRIGTSTLIHRLTDYAAARAKPLEENDVLDLLEVLGGPDALATLVDAAQRTTRPLEFASGEIPRIEQAGGMRRAFAIRSAQAVVERVKKAYTAAFDNRVDLFLESGSPLGLDVICFTLGVPSFALHALREARRLAASAAVPDQAPPEGSSENGSV